MKITLRQLEVFDAVAATGAVTSAATKLNMSQSAASIALSDFQALVGRALFAHAKGKPLQITDEGRRLQPVIRSVLREIQDLANSGADAPLVGQLVIGATMVVADTVLPRLCVEFMQLHSGVQIHVEAQSVTDLFSRLHRFELETALIENFPQVEGVELTKWRTDELILVANADHPLAGRGTLARADLIGASWCLPEPYSTVAARLRYMLHEDVGQFHVAFSSTSNWAIRLAVRAGGGIGCLPRLLVKLDLEQGRLVELPVEGFRFTRLLSLARPRNIWRNRLAKAFDDFLMERRDINE